MEDEGEEQRPQPAGAPADKYCSSDKAYNSVDRNNEKAFGSASSSSSSSTLSVTPAPRQQPPDLGDVHQEPQKVSENKQQRFVHRHHHHHHIGRIMSTAEQIPLPNASKQCVSKRQ